MNEVFSSDYCYQLKTMWLAIFVGKFFIIWCLINLCIDWIQSDVEQIGSLRFHQLIDNLFKKFEHEEVENKQEIDTHQMECNSWNSLSDLIDVNHYRVTNASKIVRDNPKKLYDNLQKDLKITDEIVGSFNRRLISIFERFPSYLLSLKNQIDNLLNTANDINHEFQYFVGNAIVEIDFDQFESHKSSCVRIAKIHQQFEHIIQSQKEEYLECTCNVAKLLNESVQNFVGSIHLCVNTTGQKFSEYMKETTLSVSQYMESIIRSISLAMERSESSIEVLYHLPMKVCNCFSFAI